MKKLIGILGVAVQTYCADNKSTEEVAVSSVDSIVPGPAAEPIQHRLSC